MTPSTDITIATALRRYLEERVRARPAARSFFRVSGFSEAAYGALLDDLGGRGWRLAEKPLELRSIAEIPGHRERAMEPGRSATWYRNNLAPDHALVLIQNRRSSDAQSLKDLYPVTETSLSRDGIDQLMDACVLRYQLDAAERAQLTGFVRRLARVVHEPQLRDLAEFMLAVDAGLSERPGSTVAEALARSLPHVGLFRCQELAGQLDGARSEKLLRQLRDAARLGDEVLDERARNDYLRRLAEAELADDAALGGLSAERKRALLGRFIEGQLREERAELLELLQIDWREIQGVIATKSRITQDEKLRRTADRLAALLPEGLLDSEDAQEVIADLQNGSDPDADTLDRLMAEGGDSLPKALRGELQRLVRQRSRRHSDFLVGLAALAVELLQPLQGELAAGARLAVRASIPGRDKQLPEALLAFRALYGGVEQLMPAVDWQLEPLWTRLGEHTSAGEEEEEPERARVVKLDLPFRVVVSGPDGAELARAELIWQYRSDSPATATAQTLAAEAGLLPHGEPRLRVPIYNSCPRTDEIGDLDIRRPIHSLGAWFEAPSDLRAALDAQLQGRSRPQIRPVLDQVLAELERTWGGFVAAAAPGGLLAAGIDGLLAAYQGLLRAAVEQLQSGLEVSGGYRALNQAWVIGPSNFESWAVVPLLHPLKLLWWRERARYIRDLIGQLLDPARPASIVDEPRFRRELAVTYGSSGFPPVLALPTGPGRPAERFLPVEEADGYELFFREAERAEAFGLDTDLLAEDENEIAAQRAVDGIAAVVQDYIETYPFVRDGIELVLFECRNGALPGLLIERLAQMSARRGWKLRVNVAVHTSDRGAPLFRRVSEWVQAERLPTGRTGQEYFPVVSVKVLECSHGELLKRREDTDIVILADVLADRGQAVVSELDPEAAPDVALDGFLPTYRAQQEPFQQGDVYRRLQLSPPQQPALSRLFLLAQHAAIERRPVRPHESARFYRELTLDAWEQVIGDLHDHFNWVVCYDPSIDRFLMESAFPEKVQVIRYSLGLGAKRQHNLTVSSSQRSQTIVERRLASRLGHMLPSATPDFLRQVAAQLVAQAKEISGDIVLRAAGPGAFLNELIGLVAAKFETERRHRERRPDALIAWILLDDFEHWFGCGKFPDLLFVAISASPDGALLLHGEVLEAKCVARGSFEAEAVDAQEQVRRGLSRMAHAFAGGAAHLDALYWYDQLYRAVNGNLRMRLEQEPLWALFRERLYQGAFQLEMSGHTWAFCYDGTVEAGERHFARRAPDLAELPQLAHHYGRNELCLLLRDLIEVAGALPSSDAMWAPAPDEHPAAVAPTPVPEVDSPPEAEPPPAPSVSDPPPPAPSMSPSPATLPEADTEQAWLQAKARDLQRALRQRGVQVLPINPAEADVGPSIVRFKLRLGPNETLRKIQSVAEDLARDLALARTPLIDNVLRTTFVGVDIPRERPEIIALRPLLEQLGAPEPAELPVIIGVSPDGTLVTEDLAEFPHLLVAGVTNSGKSVFLRGLLLSLMTQYRPRDLELLIVDPKRTDFTFFNRSPYLRGGKVIIDQKEARDALLELVRSEMPRRQELIAERSMKIKQFNVDYPDEALPPIVALIDEYALLVSQMDRKEREAFEQDLSILAAAARSVGIHLVVATQRPSADVVTSTLKANLGTQIAFRVATSVNSRVVIDEAGAENLLGRGDMLFRPSTGEMMRLQAPFMSEAEMRAYLAELTQQR